MTTKTYQANIDMGEGGTTTIEARNIKEATKKAIDWAHEAEWRVDGEVIVRVKGPDGETKEYVRVTAASA